MARTTRPTHSPRFARVSRLSRLVAVPVVGLGLAGCVSQEKYNAQVLRANQLAEQLGAAQSQVNTSLAQYEVLKHQLEMIRNSGDNKEALIASQAGQITDLTRQLEDNNARYQALMNKAGTIGNGAVALPGPLNDALTAFAAQNPGQVEFDPRTGMVKFKSDVTFSPGSAEVKPEARSAIDQFAGIVNGAGASQYDLMVVGHTDNQPVGNAATIAAGHKDNWYLSVHRAISVAKELVRQNVGASRIEVAGCGDQRPVADNASEAGKKQNRRVEVLILPTTHAGAAAAPASASVPPATTPPAARPAAKAALNKDFPVKDSSSADVERKPFLSK